MASSDPRGGKEEFAAKAETVGKASAARPQTGAQYIQSLRDRREACICGWTVPDLANPGDLSYHAQRARCANV